jgi:NAD(P)-dependent dehydrogenase (short-subunit alcohol dehydrogenase family)
VIAESFERIHRSNLVGMGVIPFEFTGGDTRKSLGLKGDETVSIHGLDTIQPLRGALHDHLWRRHGRRRSSSSAGSIPRVEIEYVEHGGVLHYVLRNLARELGPLGIRVNAVAPGLIEKPEAPRPAEIVEMVVKETPLGRTGTPEDIAGAVAFLLSEDAGFITGQVLAVSGGYRL